MPQALSGKRRSTPKVVKLLSDDDRMVVFRKVGNNHAHPFIWGDTFTIASGTDEIVVASGIKFHGYGLAIYGNVTASPMADVGGAVRWYIDKNITTNVIKIKTTANVPDTGVDFDVKFMLGFDADIEEFYCRGNTGAAQNYP